MRETLEDPVVAVRMGAERRHLDLTDLGIDGADELRYSEFMTELHAFLPE